MRRRMSDGLNTCSLGAEQVPGMQVCAKHTPVQENHKVGGLLGRHRHVNP